MFYQVQFLTLTIYNLKSVFFSSSFTQLAWNWPCWALLETWTLFTQNNLQLMFVSCPFRFELLRLHFVVEINIICSQLRSICNILYYEVAALLLRSLSLQYFPCFSYVKVSYLSGVYLQSWNRFEELLYINIHGLFCVSKGICQSKGGRKVVKPNLVLKISMQFSWFFTL